MTEQELQAVISRQLEIERKARAWDEIKTRLLEQTVKFPEARELLDSVWESVHPAQDSAKS